MSNVAQPWQIEVLRRWAELARNISPDTPVSICGTDALRTWAELGRSVSSPRHSPNPSWEPAGRMAVAARQLFEAQAEMVQSLLSESTKRLKPLADPLATDFGLHRWLAADREEAYSDWLQWILQQVQIPWDVFRLLGVNPPEQAQDWCGIPTAVGRELPVPEGHEDQGGRLDLWVRYEGKALFVLEVKKADADQADTQKQAGYKAWLDTQPETYKYPILIAVDAEEEVYEGFRLLRWSDLCIGLRRLACRLVREGRPVVAALVLALTGAVEQNLLGFFATGPTIGNPAGFNMRLVAHLERWLSEKIDDDAT